MNSVKIVAIGKIKEKNIQNMINEYEKRLKPFIKFEIKELKDKGIETDSKNILEELDNNTYILDEKGVEYTSIEFSDLIKNKNNIKFIIGGADGILDLVKKNAKKISLSNMTFTHEMARLFLVEQIYRSMMIINNRSYHK